MTKIEPWPMPTHKELSRISMGAAYSYVGYNLRYIDRQSHKGIVKALIHVRASYIKMYCHILEEHCDVKNTFDFLEKHCE